MGAGPGMALLPLPDPDLEADMYEWVSEYLEGQGYEQYEISNWSKPGFQCRHNLQYWRNLPYLGFGAGAHGCANARRVSDVLHIKTYSSGSYLASRSLRWLSRFRPHGQPDTRDPVR